VPEPIHPDQIDVANGRGLFLIRKLVDAVEFNDQGNSICMILRQAPEAIVQGVLAEAEAFGSRPADDRTILVMRI
jgi:hypothetical protein